jgi:hypothetical protein
MLDCSFARGHREVSAATSSPRLRTSPGSFVVELAAAFEEHHEAPGGRYGLADRPRHRRVPPVESLIVGALASCADPAGPKPPLKPSDQGGPRQGRRGLSFMPLPEPPVNRALREADPLRRAPVPLGPQSATAPVLRYGDGR